LTLFNALPFMAMSVTPNELETLARSADVGYVEEVRYMSLQLASSTGMIGASSPAGAWAQGVTGRGAAVAILDTGVESAHPFLSGGVVSEACFASDGNCPGGVTQSTQPGSGNPCAQWFCNHGTHVAGIAAGNGNIDSGIAGLPTADSGGGALAGVSQATEDSAAASGPGYSGVAPQADIIAINMFRRDGWITTTDMISALGRVYDLRDTYNIAAANMSIGFHVPYYDEASCDAEWASTKAAIDQLRSVGIATVIASGNAGWGNALMAPGCISSSISVGATLRSSDQVASFSDSSVYLKVLAPGDGIYSSVPGGGYTPMSGTSMATPHVVGAWALMKQKNPDLSVDEGLRILKTTGQPVLDGRNGLYHPRIDIGAALLQIEDTVAPETPTGLRAVAMSSDRIDLSWAFADDNIRVGSYKVYRNGALAAIMQGRVNSYSNTGLMPLTQYSYSVAACDEAGLLRPFRCRYSQDHGAERYHRAVGSA
jgi:subtilisin family serine protease